MPDYMVDLVYFLLMVYISEFSLNNLAKLKTKITVSNLHLKSVTYKVYSFSRFLVGPFAQALVSGFFPYIP